MAKYRVDFLGPILTGTLATIFGGLALAWFLGTGADQNAGTPSRPSTALWEKLDNPEPFARNFSHRSKVEREWTPQMVTVFDIPMSDDRRNGRRISAKEHLEFFKIVGVNDRVVIQVRREEGQRWFLSRQTIELHDYPELVSLDPEASDDAFRIFQYQMQREVDRARYILATEF